MEGGCVDALLSIVQYRRIMRPTSAPHHLPFLLSQASMSKKIKGAEKAYVKLALAYDRFMKAGDIVPT